MVIRAMLQGGTNLYVIQIEKGPMIQQKLKLLGDLMGLSLPLYIYLCKKSDKKDVQTIDLISQLHYDAYPLNLSLTPDRFF